jgi:hypothetical protein
MAVILVSCKELNSKLSKNPSLDYVSIKGQSVQKKNLYYINVMLIKIMEE